jgi:hypothetical protein
MLVILSMCSIFRAINVHQLLALSWAKQDSARSERVDGLIVVVGCANNGGNGAGGIRIAEDD